ncbi:diaminopimelate epimerase [Lysobacter helvus]|uniref:Diaminopimelate epimerase n=2 Tax=Lysobacteraceae TaxID=32033 RepID=A0ABN6FT32_9GAMM|nr:MULTISPECIES: diaminopimelate epimerase [Lysobacter]BCT92085.1 diaminopimelate epimerase [Lysobacter caseinilyticus]BCT95238.1 diaminopimelate epimerase [Lysobacter helvus]
MTQPHAAGGHGLRFSKMHGAGNDFVVVDLRHGQPAPDAALCRRLADRHAGVGCDQILTIEPPRSANAAASYRIWNADGSQAQQCGNGARCVAAWLVRDGVARAPRFEVDSPAGTHAVDVLPDGRYRIAMGVPDFEPARIPMHGVAQAADEYAVHLDGQALHIGAASMGNPHALLVVDDVDTARVGIQGPALQREALFPESVNVGFAQIESRDRIRLRVYERGVGETLACGSGACAAAAILMRRGRVDRDVVVSLPGGELQVAWPDETGPIFMAGPATFVFEGEWLP